MSEILLGIAGYEIRGNETISGDSFRLFPPKEGSYILPEYAVQGIGLTDVYWEDEYGNTRRGVVDLIRK